MSFEIRFVYDLWERGPFMLNLHNWGVRKLHRTLGTEIRIQARNNHELTTQLTHRQNLRFCYYCHSFHWQSQPVSQGTLYKLHPSDRINVRHHHQVQQWSETDLPWISTYHYPRSPIEVTATFLTWIHLHVWEAHSHVGTINIDTVLLQSR